MAKLKRTISRGLDLPINGQPRPDIEPGNTVSHVAILGDDYHGMKPTMAVREGDRVTVGQEVIRDKKIDRVKFVSPVCGEVIAVNRGEKRKFESLVIRVDGTEERTFASHDGKLAGLTREQVTENLLESGLWTAFRTRPYSKLADPADPPRSIFVTAMDSHPLSADPVPIIRDYQHDFLYGLQVIEKLTDGPVYVCKREGAAVPSIDSERVRVAEFDGPHPAGLPGTHIHFLDPVGPNKTVWHLNYQDVIAFGKLFTTGKLWTQRIVGLCGPALKQPRLVTTTLGASLTELLADEVVDDLAETRTDYRIISGSVFGGREAKETGEFLSRYHQQISVLKEGHERILLGWQRPGFDKFSITGLVAGGWLNRVFGTTFNFTTSTEGSKRAMVPIGTYERVMPLDIEPTFLLRSLIVNDSEQAQALGALELDEEDLALCSYVCPGKYEYGPILRANLTTIEREG